MFLEISRRSNAKCVSMLDNIIKSIDRNSFPPRPSDAAVIRAWPKLMQELNENAELVTDVLSLAKHHSMVEVRGFASFPIYRTHNNIFTEGEGKVPIH